MLSVKLKPALVSVIVTAGLLAAAAPASAQLKDLTQTPNAAGVGLQAPKPSVVVIDLNDPFFARNGVVTNNNDPDTMSLAGISSKVEPVELRGTQVGSEGVKAPTTPIGNGFVIDFAHTDLMARTNAGTQVGSEGAKAPTAGTQIGIED